MHGMMAQHSHLVLSSLFLDYVAMTNRLNAKMMSWLKRNANILSLTILRVVMLTFPKMRIILLLSLYLSEYSGYFILCHMYGFS